MKIKVFEWIVNRNEKDINAWLAEHEDQIEANGMYAQESRLFFVYDDGTVEEKAKRALIRSLRERIVNEEVQLSSHTQRAHEARQGSRAGKIKPDDVMNYENLRAVSEEKLAYLKKELNEFQNGREL